MSLSATWLILMLIGSAGCRVENNGRIIGVKIYEHQGSCKTLVDNWMDIGVNTVFASPGLLSSNEFRILTGQQGIATFVIFPVFYNPDALAEAPGLHAITSTGEPATDEWVEFICPSREAFRRQVVEKAQETVRELDPDGISIDFIRHFVYWEKVYPDRDPETLPLTCFDSACLAGFRESTGITLPDSVIQTDEKASWIMTQHADAWISWRSGLITSMVREIIAGVREIKPGILVNVHLVPWTADDFNGAMIRIAGQDIQALAELVDFLSPMTYSHMLKREPEWIHSIVDDFYSQGNGKVLPSIQVNRAYLDQEFTTDAFGRALQEALKPPSAGVVFWSWERLSQDPEKIEAVRKTVRH